MEQQAGRRSGDMIGDEVGAEEDLPQSQEHLPELLFLSGISGVVLSSRWGGGARPQSGSIST